MTAEAVFGTIEAYMNHVTALAATSKAIATLFLSIALVSASGLFSARAASECVKPGDADNSWEQNRLSTRLEKCASDANAHAQRGQLRWCFFSPQSNINFHIRRSIFFFSNSSFNSNLEYSLTALHPSTKFHKKMGPVVFL